MAGEDTAFLIDDMLGKGACGPGDRIRAGSIPRDRAF